MSRIEGLWLQSITQTQMLLSERDHTKFPWTTDKMIYRRTRAHGSFYLTLNMYVHALNTGMRSTVHFVWHIPI